MATPDDPQRPLSTTFVPKLLKLGNLGRDKEKLIFINITPIFAPKLDFATPTSSHVSGLCNQVKKYLPSCWLTKENMAYHTYITLKVEIYSQIAPNFNTDLLSS